MHLQCTYSMYSVYSKYKQNVYSSKSKQLTDLIVGDVVEVLDEGAEGVSVGGDHDLLAALDGGRNGLVPQGQEAVDLL